ncbi:esterase/lipase family protein [Streptomyces sp. NPDC015127]|uniref:esterase/lipase family protein n=1 Tax=Streptomyces sp. NPDC015127 TaxID=3364939 RepID=UPI0036FC4E60
MKHDLVVFVPGIGGSRLVDSEGRDVWELSLRALSRLTRPKALLERLALEPGMGDGVPDTSGIRADGLLREPLVMAGLLRHIGYPRSRDVLADLAPGQYCEFAYDWRLSNRTTARLLKTWVETRLDAWRAQAAAHYPDMEDDPKVVFLCHSMGGLVARYSVECEGGRETTRSLTTIGTPHRGAAKAVRFLTGYAAGAHRPLRWLGEGVAELCRTFPSVWQLLPVYAAVFRPGDPSHRHTLAECPLDGLDSARVQDTFAFHRELQDALTRNRAADGMPYAVHSLAGNAHTTIHGVLARPEGLTFVNALDTAQQWRGDGTVPAESAFPAWAHRTTAETFWYGHRHASMHGEQTAGRQLAAICQDKPARLTLADDGEFGLEAPDAATAGAPFEVVALRCGKGRRVRARLTGPGLATAPWTALRPDGTGALRGTLTGPPGVWTLQVAAEAPRYVQRDAILIVPEQRGAGGL